MHIKSLTIQGFKSYRDQVAIDPFSEKVNIVVGRNGAGKSNFFSAIRFVLGDAYTSLSRAERQDLLHEGSSTAATFSAYVEIVFDNSDGRIPTGKHEVILRRTIGAKKDDYSLDRKSTSKAEVVSLLESAGFSRSNPFFIVPQGRITTLTNQKDLERLELLKEIAGTRVYEDRKHESEKIMVETEQKQSKIDELLEYIDERLAELEEEKKELKEFQVADKERRCTEYCIHQRDLEEAKEALDQIENDRLSEQNQAEEMRKLAAEREAAITKVEEEIAAQREQLELVTLEKQQYETDKRESLKAQTQLSLIISDLEDATARKESERDNLEAELGDLEAEIKSREDKLAETEPQYKKLVSKEATLRDLLETSEAKQQSLFSKQGRVSQFRTQAERDDHLQEEIRQNRSFLDKRSITMLNTQNEIQQTRELLETKREEENRIKDSVETGRTDAKKHTDAINNLTEAKARLTEERKELWKEDEKLTRTAKNAQDELRKYERVLSTSMDRATQQGLQAIPGVAERLHLTDRVFGPLYSLFETHDSFRTAVENIANNSLFHVVVDNDETAAKILEVLNRDKLGRVTFMPLNRLRPPNVKYPDQAEESVPMIDKLRFDQRFLPAMQQVFSRTIIVPDLQTGSRYARSHGLTAITLQGDKQDKKGALTGGYHDTRRSRLESVKNVKQWKDKYENGHAQQAETKRKGNKLDQEITKLSGEIMVLERRLKTARDNREPLARDLANVAREIEQCEGKLDRLGTQLATLKSEIANLEIKTAALEDEVNTPLASALTIGEADTLQQLSIDIQRQKKELLAVSKDKQSLATKRSTIDIELNQNLRRKHDKLKAKIDNIADSADGGPTQSDTVLVARRAELKSLEAAIATVTSKIRASEKSQDKVQQGISEQEKEIEALQGKQADDNRGFAKQQKNVERYLAKRQLLIGRKDECSKKIRELGALPSDAFEKHKKKINPQKLFKQLQAANEKLKKFTGVNKRAFDQFNEFTNQREELATRREELTKSEESIRELIGHLDMRKDEAIERTFKQVSKNFIEVFEALVPTGRGRLIMQKRVGGEGADSEAEAEEEEDAGSAAEDEEEEDEEEEEQDMEVDGEEPASKRRKKAAGKGKSKQSKSAKSREARLAAHKKQNKGKGKATTKLEAYSGVSIKVSFNSKVDEGLRIQQLSGGQKSLVALAMIFAIQKCDPAPFYLFDEIDANLDADRRTAVAAMIRSLASNAQFIITTFRPELLASADNFFGVFFDHRKISSIKSITRDNAYEFVESATTGGNAGQNGKTNGQ